MKRITFWIVGLAILCLLPVLSVAAPLVAQVDIRSQTMTVYLDGAPTYTWPVSTARKGKITPTGTFRGQWLSRHHRSSLYKNAPMPYAIFFRGNYAIHGTNQISRLGRPASAGCVRLHPDHAAVLFNLAKKLGPQNLKVVIQR